MTRTTAPARPARNSGAPRRPLVHAAGAVVWRREPGSRWSDGRLEVVAVHRPKYDDWSLPKGKVDDGESLPACAAREVREETGLVVRLGVRLAETTYAVRSEAATKHVTYWAARPVGSDDLSRYRPNHEVDGLRWVPLEEARDLLTYERDRDVVDAFTRLVARGEHRVRTLLLVRHADASPRKQWRGDDRERPLSPAGRRWAHRLPAALLPWAPRRAVSSPAVRCTATLEPWTRRQEVRPRLDERLAEASKHGGAPGRKVAAATVRDLLERGRTIACTHRPVLPALYAALGVPSPGTVPPGAVVVVHHRDGKVVAHEVHPPSR